MAQLWGGRFSKGLHQAVEGYTFSLHVDARLWHADIRGSIAHARMLGKVGVLNADDSQKIVQGLELLLNKLGDGSMSFDPAAEDVHSEIERLLGVEIGPVAGKLHTGRSRNDQVATATRLYLREEIDQALIDLEALQSLLTTLASQHVKTILPGLTHTQHAQPVSLAHHLLAYFWMFERDGSRLKDLRARVNRLPLGSAALAGTSFPLDRKMVAQELGFEGVTENSLDSVSDRDFVVEFISAGALVLSHLSKFCEELILWSTPEFGFVELDDSVTTGSSIMPQKKNPDVAELMRARTGRLNGALMGILTVLKGLPLAYNRDLQEDKIYLFDAVDVTRSSIQLMRIMLETAEFKADRMKAVLSGDFSNATDLADDLAQKGMAFREAHEVVGRVVKGCLESQKKLEDLTLSELRTWVPQADEKTIERLKHMSVMSARITEGGTSPVAVEEQLQKAREKLRENSREKTD